MLVFKLQYVSSLELERMWRVMTPWLKNYESPDPETHCKRPLSILAKRRTGELQSEDKEKLPMFAICESEETLQANQEITEQKTEDVMPNWVTEINRIQKHNGQAPLFTEHMLSPIKDEQLSGQPSTKSLKPLRARTTSPEGQLFYRPERSHRYLQASVFESAAEEWAERPQSTFPVTHLGRPTRSSILRTRHLALSVASDPHHKERATLTPKKCSSSRPPLNPRELQPVCTSVGENVHSFLIGARYNRERYMDFVAVDKYGLYLSRSNPRCPFLTHSNADLLAGTLSKQEKYYTTKKKKNNLTVEPFILVFFCLKQTFGLCKK
ncbi:uncharacterized protein LOC136753860 [Amia ocellicauda]|uniref:uncharacterized protein LOC136753860 n=1 Tax=Amia ocellicauda TaxID=2972642 RepID=UPI0034641356